MAGAEVVVVMLQGWWQLWQWNLKCKVCCWGWLLLWKMKGTEKCQVYYNGLVMEKCKVYCDGVAVEQHASSG